jgi:hypothetical protein
MIRIADEEDTEAIRWQVAEKLGWRNTEYSVAGVFVGHPPGRKALRGVPSYAVDIKAAWEIVEYLASRHIKVDIKNESINKYLRSYRVVIGEPSCPLGKGFSRNVAVALCQAFIEVPEEFLRRSVGQTLKSGDQV